MYLIGINDIKSRGYSLYIKLWNTTQATLIVQVDFFSLVYCQDISKLQNSKGLWDGKPTMSADTVKNTKAERNKRKDIMWYIVKMTVKSLHRRASRAGSNRGWIIKTNEHDERAMSAQIEKYRPWKCDILPRMSLEAVLRSVSAVQRLSSPPVWLCIRRSKTIEYFYFLCIYRINKSSMRSPCRVKSKDVSKSCEGSGDRGEWKNNPVDEVRGPHSACWFKKHRHTGWKKTKQNSISVCLQATILIFPASRVQFMPIATSQSVLDVLKSKRIGNDDSAH